jgi:lipid-binding SYLF domain-containing protein
MRNRASLATLCTLIMLTTSALSHAQGREEGRLLTAMQVVRELRATPDQFIPDRLLQRAYGIAIVPDVTQAAFFFGGRRGNGVLVVRDQSGRFSNPIFVNLTGGSFGFQFGVESTDVVLVFTSRASIDKITGGKLTLGADASVAAGPVGRLASAATDPTFHSEVYSYSRSRGLFAGIALSGSAVTIDEGADARFYDRGSVSAADIVSGTITTQNPEAQRFLGIVNSATGTTVAAVTPPAAAVPAAASPPAAPASTGGDAQSFPLSDPAPGSEPH